MGQWRKEFELISSWLHLWSSLAQINEAEPTTSTIQRPRNLGNKPQSLQASRRRISPLTMVRRQVLKRENACSSLLLKHFFQNGRSKSGLNSQFYIFDDDIPLNLMGECRMFVSETRVSCFRFSSAEALPSCPQLPVARVSTHVLLLDLELNPKTSFSSLMKGHCHVDSF